ncbi:MAG: amidohydrolase [Desulfobacteraceae bacterium]|nr:MAG: amidohydrolase [Desulfobacteraceae bacterium]
MQRIRPPAGAASAITLLVSVFFFIPAYAQEEKNPLGPVPEAIRVDRFPKLDVPFDLNALKTRWLTRIQSIKLSGQVPIIDIESSYGPGGLDAKLLAKQMDKNGVALLAFSPEIGEKEYKENKTVWSDAARRLQNADPWRYIPVTTAGIHPAWTEEPERFLEKTIEKAEQDHYPLLGEFEFRHYMSPRQYKRNETFRDITIAIDTEVGERLFAYAERSSLPFQIHYEIEDGLLPPLEKMLAKYPKAKVIWCHLAQIRYNSRAPSYNPAYVRKLIETYPNLYFDLAFGGSDSKYPGSEEYHARVWNHATGKVKPEWTDLIADHPWRFLAAFDLGGDRMNELPEKAEIFRQFMKNLPEPCREIVAYKAAWKLLFNEEI